MDWHNSGIMSAINECKQSKSLLVVYVKDSSEGSVSTDNSWTDQQVQDVLSRNSYVALQILKDSVEFNQFMQFFPVFVIPSILCISPSGDQLAVFSGPADAKQLAITLKQGFQRLTGHPQHQASSTDSDGDDTQQHLSTASAICNSEEEEEEEKGGNTEDDQELKKQEQIRRYREKVAQNKLEKEKEAKKREKTNEIRRRREGREMDDWRREQQEREIQSLIKERQKERNEQLRARQEVLAKLEQDKKEKLFRQRSSGSNQGGGVGSTSSATPTVPSVFSAVGNNSSCRIQVKLPGAQSAVFVFDSSDTVSDLRKKVAERVEYKYDKVMLTCVYPRKELGFDLDDTTLDQHDLANGVVIARLKGSGNGSSDKPNGGGVLSLFYSLFQFILQLLVSLKNAVTGIFTSNQTTAAASQQISSSNTKPSHKQTRGEETSRFKRVKADDDEDDPNKTYNGNSTQQL